MIKSCKKRQLIQTGLHRAQQAGSSHLGIKHGCVKSSVIERRQLQLGRMADFPPPVTFSVFDL